MARSVRGPADVLGAQGVPLRPRRPGKAPWGALNAALCGNRRVCASDSDSLVCAYEHGRLNATPHPPLFSCQVCWREQVPLCGLRVRVCHDDHHHDHHHHDNDHNHQHHDYNLCSRHNDYSRATPPCRAAVPKLQHRPCAPVSLRHKRSGRERLLRPPRRWRVPRSLCIVNQLPCQH